MAKQKRISELARELGVTWKAIVEKCIAEDVPPEVVKSHASMVPAGLEASIREWFADTGGAGTAVERAEHPDVSKLRTTSTRRRSSKKSSSAADSASSGGSSETGTAVAEPAAGQTTPVPATPPSPTTPVIVSPIVETGSSTIPAAPRAVRPSISTPTTATPDTAASTSATPASTGAAAAVTAPAPNGQSTQTPAPPSTSAPPPHAQPEARPGTEPPTAPGAPRQGAPGRPGPRVPIRPAPVNVPARPTVVKPVGQVLTEKAKVTLSGPRVVRIEAPDPVSPPSPRRGPGGPAGPRAPGGRGVVGGPAGDRADDNRRNKRRSAGGDSPGARRRMVPSGIEDLPLGTGFSEADLLEREERLARAAGILKQRRREAKAREQATGRGSDSSAGGKVPITAPFTIKDLSAATGVKASEIVKRLFLQGVMATINSGIDPAKAAEIMMDFDIELDVREAQTAEQKVSSIFETRAKLDERPRAPIVTIMGHVDHGKTSLLDAIRKTNVAAGEAGGITQKTSAFKVEIEVGGVPKSIVFIDTPGHEAFTEMRARGANLTDVVVLVVGAPEGVMPQTIESINHARAAKVPIVVALNKIDSPQATESQIQKIYGQLAEQGLNPVEWGGQTEVIKTSALKGTGIKELLEILDLQAQILDLKADFKGPARGRVVEAGRDEGRGPVAMVLVQDGELNVGDFIVVGRAHGRVRDITDDQGRRLKTAGPATPVQISGLDEVPDAGDAFFVTDSLRKAQEAAEQRRQRDREAALHQPKVTLDSIFSQMKDANVKEILIVLKADVQGSVDVIAHQVEKLSTNEVKVRVLHSAVGGIQESDVLLADASKAVIVGFNVIPSGKARTLAEQKGVEIRTYQVIYDIVDDVKKAASGLLEPEIRQEVLGHAEVRKVFKVSGVGSVAGCYITDGLVQRDALIRVTRQGIVIENDRVLEQLKRFKDDAREVKAGMECGMKIVGYDDIKEGDILECYRKVEVKRTL